MLDDAFDASHLRPPPLCHQPAVGGFASSSGELDHSPPVYRSCAFSGPAHPCSSSAFEDEYSEAPVHRSIFGAGSSLYGAPSSSFGEASSSYFEEDDSMGETSPCYRSLSSHAHFSAPDAGPTYRGGDVTSAAYRDASLGHCAYFGSEFPAHRAHPREQIGATQQPPMLGHAHFNERPATPLDLPADIFDLVLRQLNCYPDLFLAMRTSRAWRDAAQASCLQRQIFVAAQPDALLQCVQTAQPGDTLVLAGGFHLLSRELTIDKPLRLLGESGAVSPPTLVSRSHVAVRTRSPCSVVGLTMCRLGDAVGYPNAVIYAEVASLSIEHCRITCGGAGAGGTPALPAQDVVRQAFDGVSRAGEALAARLPCPMDCDAADDRPGSDRPQSGLWVGAASRVRLRHSIIKSTMGPGVKVYRGALEASENTIASSWRGANVVANGGRATLLRNEIVGAVGDGVSLWNNAQMSLEHNRIHSNSGSGVSINSAGGHVGIAGNHIFQNAKSAILFVTSQPNQALLRDNRLEDNAGGGVQGLLPAGGPLLPQRAATKAATPSRTQPMPARSGFLPPRIARAGSRESSSVEL